MITGCSITVINLLATAVPPQPPVIVYVIVADPAANPVMTPVVEFTDAIEAFELVHTPVAPVVNIEPLAVKVVAVFLQIVEVPEIVPALFP